MTSLVAGTVQDNGTPSSGSMAAAIYQALNAQVPLRADEDPRGRSVIAVAVATGVINYLKANSAAFVPGGTIPTGGTLLNPTMTIN